MKIVNIYIAVDSRNTRKSKKKYGYVLELKDNPDTRDGFGEIEATYNGATLKAINEALGRLNQSCEVRIFTENKFIANMMEHNLERWACTEFRTTKGEPVENQTEWMRLWELSQEQLIMAVTGKHSYSIWIEEQMKGRSNV